MAIVACPAHGPGPRPSVQRRQTPLLVARPPRRSRRFAGRHRSGNGRGVRPRRPVPGGHESLSEPPIDWRRNRDRDRSHDHDHDHAEVGSVVSETGVGLHHTTRARGLVQSSTRCVSRPIPTPARNRTAMEMRKFPPRNACADDEPSPLQTELSAPPRTITVRVHEPPTVPPTAAIETQGTIRNPQDTVTTPPKSQP